MTDREPTPAEIETAAREWCAALGVDPDGVCEVLRLDTYSDCPPVFDEKIRWRALEDEARALIALRDADKTHIAELEGQLAEKRQDAERMDFLENRRQGVWGSILISSAREGRTIRDSIDMLRAALAATERKS